MEHLIGMVVRMRPVGNLPLKNSPRHLR